MLGLLSSLEIYHGISTQHAVVPGVTLIPGAAYLLKLNSSLGDHRCT